MKTIVQLILITLTLLFSISVFSQDDKVYTVVEEMPRFPGCENIEGTIAEKKTCAEKKMLNFLYNNLRYPSVAKENGILGAIVIRFIIDENGQIEKPTILKNPGGGLGEEVLRVVKLMNELPECWTAGKHEGKTVKVQFQFPIRIHPAD